MMSDLETVRRSLGELAKRGVPAEALAPIYEWMEAKYPRPHQLTLGELVQALKRADPDYSVPVGFIGPHSYRGYYEDCAFVMATNVPVRTMVEFAEGAVGTTYQGWKGGDYEMGRDTNVWLVGEVGDCGESLGAVLLSLMLRDAGGDE